MKNVEIPFETSFCDDTPISINLGRLVIGDGICRVVFGTDGKMAILCDEKARSHIRFRDKSSDLYI